MRELAFRADTKAKRLAKIKSKTYRRLKKRQKRKLTEKLDASEDSADDEEKRLQREVERAKERATLKHKNTGKWAKAMKARGELDEDQRQEVLDMLQRGEQLRRKIHAEGEDGDDDSEDDSDLATKDDDRILASAFDEVARTVEEEVPEHSKKSLFSMKFMKDAMARNDKKAQDMADEFLKDLVGSDAEASPDKSDDDLQDRPLQAKGRFSFRPGTHVCFTIRVFTNTQEGSISFNTGSTHNHGPTAPRCYWRRRIHLSDFIPDSLVSVDNSSPHPIETFNRRHFHHSQ